MNTDTLEFRQLDRQQVDTLVGWAREEGWDPGIHDADIFHSVFPDGFFGCFLDDRFIGGGSLVSYHGEYGFMGFFIVMPEYRNAGIGRFLWYKRRDTLLACLKQGAVIGMDGVVAMQPFYRRGGFKMAYRDERRVRLGAEFPRNDAISGIVRADLDAVAAYDRECFGFDRRPFLDRWLFDSEAASFRYLAEGNFAGYAVLRRTGKGFKIGPLFADSLNIARELYRACLSTAPGRNVYLDIPMNNIAAVSLAEEFGAAFVFECARMYCGPEPLHRRDKVFGITTFELG
ncbi:MAG: GNAT family N-acetyltransferase [Chlorobiaceae bacterium]|nr:GNAT family N-acetyltransferase [Chlorobiaceae bacterium]NTV60435.1 GNAT family N-acetyltransferase [Chlorobiaceae bacterium]